jgi:hypothetical protein
MCQSGSRRAKQGEIVGAKSGEAALKKKRPVMLIVEVGLGPQEDVKVPEEGALVCVPASVRVAVEDGKLGLSLNMKIRFDKHTTTGTELQVIFVGVPDPLIGMG